MKTFPNNSSLPLRLILSLIVFLTFHAAVSNAGSIDENCPGLSAGEAHTCVLTSNGNVDCYGNNDFGRAADYTGGDAVGVAAGLYHTCVLTSNGNVDCYGNNDFGQAADYTGGDAVGVAAGLYHTCVLTSNGNVDCYGNNGFSGQAADYTGGDAVTVRLLITLAEMLLE
jgi:alpha-tubulin suppressor-like RCC1 family protein